MSGKTRSSKVRTSFSIPNCTAATAFQILALLMHRLCLAKRQHTLKLIECSRTWSCLLFCANRQAVAASTRCAAEYADLHLDQHLPVSITWGSCSTSYRLDHDTVNGCRNPSVAAGEPRVYLREEANPRAGNRRVENRLGRLA